MNKFNSDVLPQGFPFLKEYVLLSRTDSFLNMERFSNSFLMINHCKHDPLHQWSRRWEYSFTYSYICSYVNRHLAAQSSEKIEILDAGSGFTFFPYYISHQHSNCSVHCCDYDHSLASLFINANEESERKVDFRTYDLAGLGYEDDTFDILYCISVLEHVSNQDGIFEEFGRVLKPDGLLILTFDIPLEDRDKSESYAQNLLNRLNSRFVMTDDKLKNIRIPSEDRILTTKFAKDFDKKSLPWISTWSSTLGDLKKLRFPRTPFSFLTIFCGVWRNRDKISHFS